MTEKKEYKIRINGTQVTVSREVYTVHYASFSFKLQLRVILLCCLLKITAQIP